MNISQANRLNYIVKRLIKASIDDSWKGGGHPADIPLIENKLSKLLKQYNSYVKSLTKVETK